MKKNTVRKKEEWPNERTSGQPILYYIVIKLYIVQLMLIWPMGRINDNEIYKENSQTEEGQRKIQTNINEMKERTMDEQIMIMEKINYVAVLNERKKNITVLNVKDDEERQRQY